MLRAADAENRFANRVAIPVDGPPAVPGAVEQTEKPSLVPADVWLSYQQELQRADDDSQEDPAAVAEEGSVSGIHPSGLLASSAADLELAVGALSQVKLFKHVSREGLEHLARPARQGQINEGDYLFRENDHATSFFVVVEGAVEVMRRREEREVVLRHMDAGDAIGVFGLLSGQRRAACARAIGDAMVLEIPCEALNELLVTDAKLRHRLLRFYKERLLEGFLGSSRLFADVDSIARGLMIARFVEKKLKAGETLLHPGEVCNAIAVVITGKLMFEIRPRAGQASCLLELYPGQFVAITGAFTGSPSRTRIYAGDPTTLVMLGQKELSELLRDYPALRSITSRLPANARQLDRDVFCGHTGVPGL